MAMKLYFLIWILRKLNAYFLELNTHTPSPVLPSQNYQYYFEELKKALHSYNSYNRIASAGDFKSK